MAHMQGLPYKGRSHGRFFAHGDGRGAMLHHWQAPRGKQIVWGWGGRMNAPGTRRASFVLPFPSGACFCPPSPNNLLRRTSSPCLPVGKNLAHPLHPVYDDGKGGGWKWWE